MRGLVALVVALGFLSVPAGVAAYGPISTGIGFVMPQPYDSGSASVQLARIETSGAKYVRIVASWTMVAPAKRPAAFQARDPNDSAYSWANLDGSIRDALAHGLEPIVDLTGPAPAWAAGGRVPSYATRGVWKIDSGAYGDFAAAAAIRYNGQTLPGLRVRYWEAWNEPNLTPYLAPQLMGNRPYAPILYRKMVNAFAEAVHAAAPGNLVIAGAVAPFRDITAQVQRVRKDWGPLTFMRSLLCLSATLKKTCTAPVEFDIWAVHPYTSGGPEHHAVLPDDVSLGDLPKMKAVLDAAIQAGNVRSVTPRSTPIWIDEFSWDSSPPDPAGVPNRLLTRWVAELLYRMWDSAIRVVIWFTLQDEPVSRGPYQSGLYYYSNRLASARPKPMVQAFRFPFVAYARTTGLYVWGRTPDAKPASVAINRQSSRGVIHLGTVEANRFGIFQATFPTDAKTGSVQAEVLGAAIKSPPFSLTVPPDRFFNPFGLTGLEPKRK